MMSVEQSVESELAGETDVLGDNLPLYPPEISHDLIEPGPPRWEAGD
jgi:hypothetical protein